MKLVGLDHHIGSTTPSSALSNLACLRSVLTFPRFIHELICSMLHGGLPAAYMDLKLNSKVVGEINQL